MKKVVHDVIVDVLKGTCKLVTPIDIHQGDDQSHVLKFHFRNGDKLVEITESSSLKIEFYKDNIVDIESPDVSIDSYYRGEASYVLRDSSLTRNYGRYTTYIIMLDSDGDEVLRASFIINVAKSHDYSPKSSEIALTKEFYKKLNEHMDDEEIHLQEVDRDFMDTFNEQVDALLKTIRDNEFVKELELNSTPKDITSLSQGVYLVLTEGKIKLPASDLDDQSIPVSTTLSQGSVIYVNGNSYNVVSDKESYSVSKVLSTGFYKYKLSLDEKTKRSILKDIEDLKEGKQGSLTPGDGININESTGEISVDDTIARVENVSKSLDKKVDKVEGKELSTNDFTDSYKETLDSLPEELSKKQDADKLVKDQFIDDTGTPIEGVTRDNYIGAEAAIDGLQKLYSIIDLVKQDKLDASNAGSNITITNVNGVLKINARPGISILFFDSKEDFPTNYDDVDFNSFYFCKAPGEGEESNIWEEYFPIGDAEHRTVKYELLGTTKIDLSDYYKKSEINTSLDGKVDKVEGKQLSTNDYTSEDKSQVARLKSEIELTSNITINYSNSNDYPTGTYYTKRPGGVSVTFESKNSQETQYLYPEGRMYLSRRSYGYYEATIQGPDDSFYVSAIEKDFYSFGFNAAILDGIVNSLERYQTISNLVNEITESNKSDRDKYASLLALTTYVGQQVPRKTSELQNDSGYITTDDAPSEVYVGSEEPQGSEVLWIDSSTTADNIIATKAYVDEIVNSTKTRIVTDADNSVIPVFELANNTEYRFMLELESIEFTLPENTTDDYISSIVFKSGATATTITYPDTIKWSGDSMSSNKFVPASSKTYEILIYWNGFNYCGIVKGW